MSETENINWEKVGAITTIFGVLMTLITFLLPESGPSRRIFAIIGIMALLIGIAMLLLGVVRLREYCARLRRHLPRWAMALLAKARAICNRLQEPVRRVILAAVILITVLLALVFLSPHLLTYSGFLLLVSCGLPLLGLIVSLNVPYPAGRVFMLLILSVVFVGWLLFLPLPQPAERGWPDSANFYVAIDFSDPRTMIMTVFLVLCGLVGLTTSFLTKDTRRRRQHVNYSFAVIASLPQLAPTLEKRETELITIVRARWADFIDSLRRSHKPFLAEYLEPFEPMRVRGHVLYLACAYPQSLRTPGLVPLFQLDLHPPQALIEIAVRSLFGNALIKVSFRAIGEEGHAELVRLRGEAQLPENPVATQPLPWDTAFTEPPPNVVFYDDFESETAWSTDILKWTQGTVTRSSEVSHSGTYSLKKDGGGDPHGGYRKLDTNIGPGFVFSGWIYRPAKPWHGAADRLAIEDEGFSGYGFSFVHTSKQASIDRRQGAELEALIHAGFSALAEQWYHFEFLVKADGKLELRLGDSATTLNTVAQVSNQEFGTFDRVTLHGGSPYYVDELKIRTL